MKNTIPDKDNVWFLTGIFVGTFLGIMFSIFSFWFVKFLLLIF